jgi:hypothetical protein
MGRRAIDAASDDEGEFEVETRDCCLACWKKKRMFHGPI